MRGWWVQRGQKQVKHVAGQGKALHATPLAEALAMVLVHTLADDATGRKTRLAPAGRCLPAPLCLKSDRAHYHDATRHVLLTLQMILPLQQYRALLPTCPTIPTPLPHSISKLHPSPLLPLFLPHQPEVPVLHLHATVFMAARRLLPRQRHVRHALRTARSTLGRLGCCCWLLVPVAVRHLLEVEPVHGHHVGGAVGNGIANDDRVLVVEQENEEGGDVLNQRTHTWLERGLASSDGRSTAAHGLSQLSRAAYPSRATLRLRLVLQVHRRCPAPYKTSPRPLTCELLLRRSSSASRPTTSCSKSGQL